MTDADGATLTLADFKGKPVLLNFWASWCGPCQSEMPDIQTAWKEHGTDVEFVIVNMTGMNGETEQSAKASSPTPATPSRAISTPTTRQPPPSA